MYGKQSVLRRLEPVAGFGVWRSRQIIRVGSLLEFLEAKSPGYASHGKGLDTDRSGGQVAKAKSSVCWRKSPERSKARAVEVPVSVGSGDLSKSSSVGVL